MTRYEMELTFKLPEGDIHDDYSLSDAVYNAGFHDAVVGTGNPEYLVVAFDIEGEDKNTLVKNAENKLLKYLPEGSVLHQSEVLRQIA